MSAICFHCGGPPVGVCSRCNVLDCSNHGIRIDRFKCANCGSAQIASSAIKLADQRELNEVTQIIVMEGASPDPVSAVVSLTDILLIFDSTRRIGMDDGPTVRDRAERLMIEIEESMGRPDTTHRTQWQAQRNAEMTAATGDTLLGGIDPPTFTSQVAEMWDRFPTEAKMLMSVALVRQYETSPATWTATPVFGRASACLNPGTTLQHQL